MLAAIYFCGILLKLPGVIFPPNTSDCLYDYSAELAMLFSVFGLFAGLLPAGGTFWSLGIYGLPLVFLYSLDAVYSHPQIISALFRHDPGILLKELATYIAGAYLHPGRQLVIGRALVAIITSFSPLAVYLLLARKNKIIAAVSSAVILLTSPYLIRQSYSLMPDAIGLTFFSFALAMTLKEGLNPKGIFITGFLLGLAIASKFTYWAYLPVAILAVLFSRGSNLRETFANSTRKIFILFSGLVIPIFIFIPFIWTSPLALAKNTFGVIAMYYNRQIFSWVGLFLVYFPLYLSWLALIFCVIGLVRSFYILGKKTAILLGLGFFLFLFSLGEANSLLPRYILPLVPYLCVYSGLGIEALLEPLKKSHKIFLMILILGIVLASHILTVVKDFKSTHSHTNARDCRNWVSENLGQDAGIALPEYISYWFVPSEATLSRWLNDSSKSYSNIDERLAGLCSMTKMRHIDLRGDNPLVPRVFGLIEQQRIFAAEMLLWYYRNVSVPKKAYNLFLYMPSEYYHYRVLTSKKEDGLKLFLEKKIKALVTDLELALPASCRVIYFNRYPGVSYRLYINPEVQDRVL